MSSRPKKTRIARTRSGFTIHFSEVAGRAFAKELTENKAGSLTEKIVNAVKSEAELRAELRDRLRPQSTNPWEGPAP